MGMIFGTRNVGISVSLVFQVQYQQLAKYMSDIVGIQEVRWDKDGNEPEDILLWKWECQSSLREVPSYLRKS